MKKQITISIKMILFFTIILGFGYTFAITLIGNIFFKDKANGSLVKNQDKIVGSSLIGQKFEDPRLFWSRPSASDYKTIPASASNYGPISKALKAEIAKRAEQLKKHDPDFSFENIPADLLFASASGIDPHISPENAIYQANRIKNELNLNNLEFEKLIKLIKQNTKTVDLGFLGRPTINVLLLNIELKKEFNIN